MKKAVLVLLSVALAWLSGQAVAQRSTVVIGGQTITGNGSISIDRFHLRSHGGRTLCSGPGCAQLQGLDQFSDLTELRRLGAIKEQGLKNLDGSNSGLERTPSAPQTIVVSKEKYLAMLDAGHTPGPDTPRVAIVVGGSMGTNFWEPEIIGEDTFLLMLRNQQESTKLSVQKDLPIITKPPADGKVFMIELPEGYTLTSVGAFYNCSVDALTHLARALHGDNFDPNRVHVGQVIPLCVGIDDPYDISKLSLRE